MSKISKNNRRYGWKRDLPDHRDNHIAKFRTPNLPNSVDLRSKMPAVYDQGDLGACTGNAIAGAVEHQLITQGLTDFTPSRLFIYYNERALEGTVSEDAGACIRDGIKTVVRQGVCSETEWPYDIKQFTVKPNEQCYTDARKNIVQEFSSLGQNSLTLKSTLAQGFPIVFGITIFESFESEEVANTGIVPMPDPKEECLGGHAVLICGYDNNKSAFLVRNSWGENWGLKGYFYLPYKYVLNPGLASDFWVIKLVK